MRILFASIRKIWYDIRMSWKQINIRRCAMLEGIKSMVEASCDILIGETTIIGFRDSIVHAIEQMTSEELDHLAHIIIKGATQ